MDTGECMPVEEEMVDYTEDPWQGLRVFSTPEITEILSPALVQERLKKMPARNEVRVSVTSPFAEEGLLGYFAARPLNPSLGGAPYTLFSSSTNLHGFDAVITHSEFFKPMPQQSP